jgi:hypothetical protein
MTVTEVVLMNYVYHTPLGYAMCRKGPMTMWKRTTLIAAGALAVLAISTGCSSSNESEHPAGVAPLLRPITTPT